VLDNSFDQACRVRSGGPGVPGPLGLTPEFALLRFYEFVPNQGVVQHAVLPFVLVVFWCNTVLLRMVSGDHPAWASSLRPVCLEQVRQATANPKDGPEDVPEDLAWLGPFCYDGPVERW
jgi:hypothetical protein